MECSPYHPSCIIEDDAIDNRVDRGDGHFTSLGGKGQQNPGGQEEEENGRENGNGDAFHCIVYI